MKQGALEKVAPQMLDALYTVREALRTRGRIPTYLEESWKKILEAINAAEVEVEKEKGTTNGHRH